MFFFILLVFASCGPKPYVNESFNPQNVSRITVLPFIVTFRFLARYLKYYSRYRTEMSGDIGSVSSYLSKDLPVFDSDSNEIKPGTVNPEWIKHLGPTSEDWVLVPTIDELDCTWYVIRASGIASVTLHLFNKNKGELSWSCKGTGVNDSGYLIDSISHGAAQDFVDPQAKLLAAIECLKLMPERPRPYHLSNSD